MSRFPVWLFYLGLRAALFVSMSDGEESLEV